MIAFSHPTGNANARAIMRALEESRLLDSVHTTLAFSGNDPFLKLLPPGLRTELLRRNFPVAQETIHTNWFLESVRLAAIRLNAKFLTTHGVGLASTAAVYRGLDRSVARYLRRNSSSAGSSITGVYAYEDGALETFKVARQLGINCFYDLPIAYWQAARQLMADEAQRLPEWACTLDGLQDSDEILQQKSSELELADAVICPSQFVYRSLPESIRSSTSCLVAEFGTSGPAIAQEQNRRNRGGVLRVLFAGSMTQRKGLADVFQAVKLLNRSDVELVVLGSTVAPMGFYRSQMPHFTYEPPRAHADVLKLMSSCDVLVLPSIVEGRALVQQEAMSCNLPIVVTANAGGEDLVEEGRTGFLVPIRSPDFLAEKIAWCADNRGSLIEMGEQASLKARSVTWAAYERAVISLVKEMCK